MSLLLKHDGRWMHSLSGWWSSTELTKNCSQAIHSKVFGLIDLLPLLPCSETITPSLNLWWSRQMFLYSYYELEAKLPSTHLCLSQQIRFHTLQNHWSGCGLARTPAQSSSFLSGSYHASALRNNAYHHMTVSLSTSSNNSWCLKSTKSPLPF